MTEMPIDIAPSMRRFDELVERASQPPAITVAVCYPLSKVALKGAVEAAMGA
jgi:hypothetical protein